MSEEKVNFENLKKACDRMSSLLSDPHPGLMTWLFAFREVSDDIRFELDGSESPIPAVRHRAERESATQPK